MARSVLKRVGEWRPGRLARNTAHAGVWNILRAGLQAATLILMARLFGPDAYGRLSGTVSLYVTIAQIVGFGSGIALVRHLSRKRELLARFAATQTLYFLSGCVLALIGIAASNALLGDALPLRAYACLAVAEIVVAPLLLPRVYRFQAEERMSVSGGLLTVAPFARLLAVTTAMIAGVSNVESFAALYLGGLVIAVLAASIATRTHERALGRADLGDVIREGIPFVVGSVATTGGAELDKTVLLRLAGGAVAGHYAAAYRIVSAAMIPVSSMILAIAPRMFRGDYATRTRLPTPVLLATMVYATGAAGVIWLLAPLTHFVLGDAFRDSEPVLRWLSIIVVTGSVRQVISASLTTTDRQWTRNLIEFASMSLVLGLLLTTVPSMGAKGAVVAVVMGDLLAITVGYLSLRPLPDRTDR